MAMCYLLRMGAEGRVSAMRKSSEILRACTLSLTGFITCHSVIQYTGSNNLMPSSRVKGPLDHVTQAARPATQVLGMPAVGSMRGLCEGRRTCCGTESLLSLAAALPVKMRAF